MSAEAIAYIRAVVFIMQDSLTKSTDPASILTHLETKMTTSMQALADAMASSLSDKLEEACKFIDATTVAQAEATMKITQAVEKCTSLTASMTSTSEILTTAAALPPVPAQEARSWAQVAASSPPANPSPHYAFDPSEPPKITKLCQCMLLKKRMIMVEPCTIAGTCNPQHYQHLAPHP